MRKRCVGSDDRPDTRMTSWDRYSQSGLPTQCMACERPEYVLHYLRRKHVGREEPGDVIPLCPDCHRKACDELKKRKLPAARTVQVLQAIFGWSDAGTASRFECFLPHWERQRRTGEELRERKVREGKLPPRSENDFYKISRDSRNVIRCIKDGYTPEQVGKMYNVKGSYVRGYMDKFPEYFD